MKYFTLETYLAHPDWDADDESQDRWLATLKAEAAAYERRLNELKGRLPDNLMAIAPAWHVDDALVSRVCFDKANGWLLLTLRCGNIPDGYFDLTLRYEGVDISEDHLRVLSDIACNTSCTQFDNDAYVHELDLLDNGRVEHRFLFYPGMWFAIRCDRMSWERTERRNRTLPRFKHRFRVVNGSD